MIDLYVPALIAAVLITTLELTEVVVLVFALGAESSSIRHGAAGAVAGVAVVGGIALGFGAAIVAFPRLYLLWVSAILLAAFGAFLFRSTLKSYRRLAAQKAGTPPPTPGHSALQFAGGFSVGAVETTEVVVVLIALAAAGYGWSALIGAVAAGIALVIAAFLVHEKIRRIKVPWLKLGATSLLFSFAVFWAGEAVGVAWPGADLFLVPLVVLFGLLVRGAIAAIMRGDIQRAPSPAP